MLNFLKRKLGITITTGCLAILMIIIPIKNYIHAEILTVANGFISINSKGIFYRYDGIEKTEIKDYNNQSIQLPQPILQNSFGENRAGILSISHLVKNQTVEQNELVTDKGILFFEKDSRLEIPYGTRFDVEFDAKSSQINNLIFAMIGISSTKALVNNRGIMNLNINYVFFVANKIENNVLNYLINNNSGEISIGLDAIGVSIIGYNLLNGGSSRSSLFNNFNYPTIALYGRFIAIYGNIINSADGYTTLFSGYRTMTIGSASTETSIISGNELKGKEKSLLFGNFGDSTLVIYGICVAIEHNIITSTNKIAHLFFNKKGKMTIGAANTETLGISYNKLESKGYAALSYNYSDGSAIILYGRSIVVEGNILNSTNSYAYLFYNRDGTRTIIGSADTERSIFNNNDLRGKNTTSLFFNFARSIMIVYGRFVTVDSNTISSNGHIYFFYNHGEMTIGNSGTIITETLAIVNNSSRNKYNNSLFNNINSALKINAKSITFKNNALNSTGHDVHLIYNEGTTDIGIEATEKTLFNNNIVNGNGIISSLIYNHDNSIINFIGNSIDVTNNIIFPAFTFHGNHRDKYSVVFNNKGTINFYLNGNNPSFMLANNVIVEGSNGRSIIGFLMEDNSQVIFTNNSNTIATFVLGHDIRSNGNNHSVLTFKNSNGYNGSFLIRPKINTIEVDNINIEANTIIYIGVNTNRITRLIGIGDNSNLFITNDKILTMDIDENNLNGIIFNKSYIVTAGFDFIFAERGKLYLISKTIKYNGEDIDVTINYNNEDENKKPIITALFTRKKNLLLYEQDNNDNIEKLEEDKTDNNNSSKRKVGTVSKKVDSTAIVPSSTNIRTDKNSNNNEEYENSLPIIDKLCPYKYNDNLPILSRALKDRSLSSTIDQINMVVERD